MTATTKTAKIRKYPTDEGMLIVSFPADATSFLIYQDDLRSEIELLKSAGYDVTLLGVNAA